MEHEEAIETKAAERYALGEMDEMDREAFEEHFFDCPVCSESVRCGAAMMDGGRAVMRERPPNVVPFRQPSRAPVWLSTAAAVAAFAMLGYQQMVRVPELIDERDAARAPRIVAELFLEGATRAESSEPKTLSVRRGEMGMLTFNILPDATATGYVAEVRNSGGRSLFALPVSRQQANETVFLVLPAGSWPAGQYQLIVHAVRDGSRRVAESFPFVVRVQ